eukprot:COSAG01_NODE_1134_length_11558_cov_8.381360_17_plen_93_part_00
MVGLTFTYAMPVLVKKYTDRIRGDEARLVRLLTRRARTALGTATQCTCINDSPVLVMPQVVDRARAEVDRAVRRQLESPEVSGPLCPVGPPF